jgi:hypothetical protein
MASNTRVFHCVKGRLTTEDQLSLLVWLFEVSPSSIVIEGNKVTVPSTLEVLHIYDNYCTTRNAYKFSAPKVIQNKYGIMLRRFNETTRDDHFQQKMVKKMAKASYESKILTDYNVEMPFTVDRTGKTVLDNVSDSHPIAGDWNPKTRQWEFEEGLGYRNTGLKLPLSCSGIHFQTDSKGLGYIGGENTRRSDSPIRFVKPAAVVIEMEEGEVE